MPFSGSGTWTNVYNWVNDAAAGIKILASRQQTQWDDIASNGLSNVICKDGQTTITADIPFNGHKITGLAVATATNDALSYGNTATFSGNVTFGDAGVWGNSGLAKNSKLSIGISAASNFALALDNNNATAPSGFSIQTSLAATNSTATNFLYCNDSGAVRAQIYSNGGLANYSANNVNLSDIRTKPDFVVLDDAELDKLEAAFIAVDWAKYKYHDQTHDDWNYGPSAQGVEKAFAVANPAITDVWNPTKQVKVGEDEDGNAIYEATPTPADEQLKGIYSADLENIGLALLARLLRRVAALEAKGG